MLSLAGEIHPFEGVSVDVGQLGDEWLQARGKIAGGIVGPVFGWLGLWPILGGGAERFVDVACAVVVDDGVASRPVEPGGGIVDMIERAGGDAAHEHILSDVSGEIVADAGRDEDQCGVAARVECSRPGRWYSCSRSAAATQWRTVRRHGLPR